MRLAQLAALDEADPVAALRGLLAIAPGWTDAGLFMRARNVRAADRAAVIASVPAVARGVLIAVAGRVRSHASRVLTALAAHHAASPELPGLQAERLRLSVAERPPVAGFAWILEALLREGVIAQDGPWFRLPGHRISLSPQD